MAEEYSLEVQKRSWNIQNFKEHIPLGYEMQTLCCQSAAFPHLQEDFRNVAYEYQSLEHDSSVYFSECKIKTKNFKQLMDLMQESVPQSDETMIKKILDKGCKWAEDMKEQTQKLGRKFYGKREILKKLLHNLRLKLASEKNKARNTEAIDSDRRNENLLKRIERSIKEAISRFINWLRSLFCHDVGSNRSATEQSTSNSEEPQEAEEKSPQSQGAVDKQIALEKLTLLETTIQFCYQLWDNVAQAFFKLYNDFDIQLSFGRMNIKTTHLESWKKNWQDWGDFFHELFKKSTAEEEALDEFLSDGLPQPLTEEWKEKCGKITADIQNTDSKIRVIVDTIACGA